MGKFIKIFVSRSGLFLYLFALITASSLAFQILPITDIISGLIVLADTNALSGIVSFAQWVIADGVLQYTIMIIFAVPVPLAIILSLLFAGAFGSFAKGMDRSCGFPAKANMGFWGGYRSRSIQVFLLFYAIIALILLFAFVWIISAIPLAVINELVSRGALQPGIFYALLSVTLMAVYIGLMFLRIYSMSFVPALFSGSRKPVFSAFSFASHSFFHISKYYIATDVLFILLSILYNYFEQSIYMLLFNCAITALLIFILFYMIFRVYAAKGYGYDELDGFDGRGGEIDGYDENEDSYDGYNDERGALFDGYDMEFDGYIDNKSNAEYNNSGNNGEVGKFGDNNRYPVGNRAKWVKKKI